MQNKGKYYITTAIAYTSGKPHIGNILFRLSDGKDPFPAKVSFLPYILFYTPVQRLRIGLANQIQPYLYLPFFTSQSSLMLL